MTKPKLYFPIPTMIQVRAANPADLPAALKNVLGEDIALGRDERVVTANLQILAQTVDEFQVISDNRFYWLNKSDVLDIGKNCRLHRSGRVYLRGNFRAELVKVREESVTA